MPPPGPARPPARAAREPPPQGARGRGAETPGLPQHGCRRPLAEMPGKKARKSAQPSPARAPAGREQLGPAENPAGAGAGVGVSVRAGLSRSARRLRSGRSGAPPGSCSRLSPRTREESRPGMRMAMLAGAGKPVLLRGAGFAAPVALPWGPGEEKCKCGRPSRGESHCHGRWGRESRRGELLGLQRPLRPPSSSRGEDPRGPRSECGHRRAPNTKQYRTLDTITLFHRGLMERHRGPGRSAAVRGRESFASLLRMQHFNSRYQLRGWDRRTGVGLQWWLIYPLSPPPTYSPIGQLCRPPPPPPLRKSYQTRQPSAKGLWQEGSKALGSISVLLLLHQTIMAPF